MPENPENDAPQPSRPSTRRRRPTSTTGDSFLAQAQRLVDEAEKARRQHAAGAKAQDKVLQEADKQEEVVLQATGLELQRIEDDREQARAAQADHEAEQRKIDNALSSVKQAVRRSRRNDKDDKSEQDRESDDDKEDDSEPKKDQRSVKEPVKVKDDKARPVRTEPAEPPVRQTRVVDHDEPKALPPARHDTVVREEDEEPPAESRPIWEQDDWRRKPRRPSRARQTVERVTTYTKANPLAVIVAVVVFAVFFWLVLPIVAHHADGNEAFAGSFWFKLIVSAAAGIFMGLLVQSGEKTTTVTEQA